MSALAAGKIDFSPRPKQPTPASLALETLVSLTGSLPADAILVAIGTRIFPATSGYVHFRFSDHGGLTTAAVIIACVAWPVVTRISTAPHLGVPTYGRPGNGGPAAAGPVHPCQGLAPPSGLLLMVMHLAIAAVTYNALVRLAPARRTTSLLGGRRRSRW